MSIWPVIALIVSFVALANVLLSIRYTRRAQRDWAEAARLWAEAERNWKEAARIRRERLK